MGHIRLGTLAATRRWQDVIGLIAELADGSRLVTIFRLGPCRTL